MEKIAGPARPASERLDFARPVLPARRYPRHPRIHCNSGVLIMTYFDFNSASEQTSFDLIPKGSRGACAHDHQTRWLRRRLAGLDRRLCHPQRQHRLGLSELRIRGDRRPVCAPQDVVADRPLQPQGSGLGQHGSHLRQAILNSARGIHPGDNSPAAQTARRISGFADLDGIEFVGKVDWEKDQNGEDKNVIKAASHAGPQGLRRTDGCCTLAVRTGIAGITVPPTPTRRPPAARQCRVGRAGRSKEDTAMMLRPRQPLVERTVAALLQHGNTLGVAPTGAGKTIMLSAVTGGCSPSPTPRPASWPIATS